MRTPENKQGGWGEVPPSEKDRAANKGYHKLFTEEILINLHKIDITCRSSILLVALENKTAVRTGEILTAGISWLPSADSNHGPDG
jgi:hypothetical protein